jgi:hypothetical protein
VITRNSIPFCWLASIRHGVEGCALLALEVLSCSKTVARIQRRQTPSRATGDTLLLRLSRRRKSASFVERFGFTFIDNFHALEVERLCFLL